MSTLAHEPIVLSSVLRDHSQVELAELYAGLPAVSADEMRGAWSGEMLGLAGVQHLGRPALTLVHRLLASPVVPWQGKAFEADRGVNLWGSGATQARWLHNKLEPIEESPIDGRPSLWLDYDVPENLRPLRHIRGELRRLDPGTVLGRMSWQTRKRVFTLLYFPLAPYSAS